MMNSSFSFMISEHTTFISWYHIFDVDVSVFTSVSFKDFQSLLNKISQILVLSLSVIDLISYVH